MAMKSPRNSERRMVGCKGYARGIFFPSGEASIPHTCFWLVVGSIAEGMCCFHKKRANYKHESVEVRLPKIKRWHARLRMRLKDTPPAKLHLVWGTWLPENRLSIGQVPRNLQEGIATTNAEKSLDSRCKAGLWQAFLHATDHRASEQWGSYNATTRAAKNRRHLQRARGETFSRGEEPKASRCDRQIST